MSRWEPHLDLMRLLDALANEIAATTDYEVRRMCDEGWCTAATAKEVRELISAVSGDPSESGIDADIDLHEGLIEVESPGHHGSVAEPGGRPCHRPH
jgi:hypothetical protein